MVYIFNSVSLLALLLLLVRHLTTAQLHTFEIYLTAVAYLYCYGVHFLILGHVKIKT